MAKLDYEPRLPRRRFRSRAFTYLLLAGFFAFTFLASEWAIIPSARYETRNVIAGFVLIALAALFGYLALRSYRTKSR